MKVGIIGLGNLGSAIACLIASNQHAVLAWEYDVAVIQEVNKYHRNQRYLPDIVFPENIQATAKLDEVFSNTNLVFIALPARFILPALSTFAASGKSVPALVNLAKGFDAKTGKTAMQLLAGIFPNADMAMLAGPSLANEFSRGVATAVVVASLNKQLSESITTVLNNHQFAVRYTDDVVGVELGGILKNIYALGMGIFANHAAAGLNFVGAYFTQALTEIQRFSVSYGAKPETIMLLSGVGDLITTSLSHDSHNVTMGKYIGSGLSLTQIEEKMRVLPEGYNTLQVALTLAAKNGVALPLAELLLRIIHREITLENFFIEFTRLQQKL